MRYSRSVEKPGTVRRLLASSPRILGTSCVFLIHSATLTELETPYHPTDHPTGTIRPTNEKIPVSFTLNLIFFMDHSPFSAIVLDNYFRCLLVGQASLA